MFLVFTSSPLCCVCGARIVLYTTTAPGSLYQPSVQPLICTAACARQCARHGILNDPAALATVLKDNHPQLLELFRSWWFTLLAASVLLCVSQHLNTIVDDRPVVVYHLPRVGGQPVHRRLSLDHAALQVTVALHEEPFVNFNFIFVLIRLVQLSPQECQLCFLLLQQTSSARLHNLLQYCEVSSADNLVVELEQGRHRRRGAMYKCKDLKWLRAKINADLFKDCSMQICLKIVQTCGPCSKIVQRQEYTRHIIIYCCPVGNQKKNTQNNICCCSHGLFCANVSCSVRRFALKVHSNLKTWPLQAWP